MFTKGFSISNKLSFNTRPKLYIILKLCIAICIIIHRAFVIMANPQEDRIWKFLLQILALPILLALELVLLWWCSKYKVKHHLEIIFVLLTQIGFSQLFIELSLQALSDTESYPKDALFQEVLLLNSIIIILSDSKVIKGFIILYIAIISCFRLTLYENKLYYISWGFMTTIFALSVILAHNTPKPSSPVKIINTNSRYSKLENSVEGVALIHKDKSVLYMNGLFKGLFEANTDKEALDRVLKLRKFESYSVAAQKDYLHDLKVRYATQINGGSNSTPKVKGSIDFNLRHHTQHPPSLDIPKTGSFVYGGSLLTPRPSIFTHRPSIHNPRTSLLQGRSSIMFRKESNLPSVVSTKNLDFGSAVAQQTQPQNLPIIKINLQKMAEEDQKAGSESETRSPLIKQRAAEAPSFGMADLFPLPSSTRDARLSSRSNVGGTGTNYIDTYQPEHIALRVDTQEKIPDKEEIVEGTIDQMFANLSANIDKRQNLTINQLIENMPFPLEILKGKSPSSPINPRQDSMTLGNSGVEKMIVTLKDTKHGTRIYELVLSPLIYLKKETICITVKDVSYELKSQEFSETLEAKNKALKFVSHEFRTPLNCSISLLDVMKKFVSKEVGSKYLLPALNSSKMLLNLANDILDHAQLQARKLKINIKPCKVKRVLEEVIEMMDIQASAKHIHLKLEWDSRIPQRFYTDSNRLRQIMLNLVSNALKYTNKGTITLQGKFDSPTTCLLSVIDTGVGISQRNLSRLFDEFTKIQENRHMNPNGVGLGLVISKLLSQELGHESEGLMVRSEEGKGSNFYFVLESKIEVLSEAEEESDEGESLDENVGGLFSVKTTNRNWEEIAPKMQSSQLKNSRSHSPQGRRKMTMKSDIKESRMSTQHALLQQEWLSRVSFLNYQFSKTVENLESMVSTSKKKSSDIELHRKSLFPSSGDFMGLKKGYQRSFTMEDLGNVNNVNNVNSDSEFSRFLRKMKHNCGTPKALLVDDSIFNLTALQALLYNTFGIESRVAMTGEAAIQEVIKNERCCSKCKNFKVIFMDVEMPQLNGFQTTEILRKKMLDGEISFIPIVGVTGYEPSEKRVQCLTSGMNDMVAKPVSQQLIRELIIRWMNP